MASDKTPAHKRIVRAEAGRTDWKMKALQRREENEKLKLDLGTKENRLLNLADKAKKLEAELEEANKKITHQEQIIDDLKKKDR